MVINHLPTKNDPQANTNKKCLIFEFEIPCDPHSPVKCQSLVKVEVIPKRHDLLGGSRCFMVCFLPTVWGGEKHRYIKTYLVGGWGFNPSEKICSSNWKSSPRRVKNKTYLKPPPSYNSYLEPKKAMKVLVNKWIYQGSLWGNQPKLHPILKWTSLKMTLYLHCFLIPPQNGYLMIPVTKQSKHTIPRGFGQRTIAKELADTCPFWLQRGEIVFFQSQVTNVNTFRIEVACFRKIFFGFA